MRVVPNYIRYLRELSPMNPRPPPVSRLAIAGWILFEWAVQPFFTLITTFVYAPYFAASIVGAVLIARQDRSR